MTIRVLSYHPGLRYFLQTTAPAGVAVECPPAIEKRGVGHDTLFEVLIVVADVGKDVAVGILSAWLYEKIKDYGAESVEVDGQQIPPTEAEIKRAFEVRVTHKW
jgi:hypothetical protein